MRYVPDLIPPKSKVFPEYFKGEVYHLRKRNNFLVALGWIFGVLFLLGVFVAIKHPITSLFYGLLGFIIIPPGHRWIEKTFCFRFTTKIKSILIIILLIGLAPLTSQNNKVDAKAEYQQKQKAEKELKEKAEVERIEQERKDSLAFYLNSSDIFQNEHKLDEALEKLNHALVYAYTPEEKDQLANKRVKVLSIQNIDLVKAGNYKKALPKLTDLITRTSNNSILLYNRAICYSKTGHTEEAVNDLKTAVELGDKEAGILYEKLNPIKRRVAYYVTRCCDGSTSNAKGRGACSHHGGVCDWNDPVYEEYRKY